MMKELTITKYLQCKGYKTNNHKISLNTPSGKFLNYVFYEILMKGDYIAAQNMINEFKQIQLTINK